MGRVLDGRAPLPVGVLALLEPRGALRRHRRADRAHPHRLRGAAHAQALQPSGAHGGVGGRARPALRRAGGPRHGPLVDPGRARGLRRRPGRDPAMWQEAIGHVVGCWTNDEYEFAGEYWQMPKRRVQPKPLQSPHPPIWGATSSEDGHRQVGALGLGLCSFAVGSAPGGEGQGRHLPRGRRALHQAHRRLRQQPGGHVHHGAVRAGPCRGDRRGARSPSSGTRRPVPGRSRR